MGSHLFIFFAVYLCTKYVLLREVRFRVLNILYVVIKYMLCDGYFMCILFITIRVKQISVRYISVCTFVICGIFL